MLGKELENNPLEGKNILIAEDSEMNRMLIERTLKGFDMNLQFAINGKEAIDLLIKSPIDLILMDVQMPVMDGIEATQFIRNKLQNNLPIIALTASDLKSDIENHLNAGMNDTVAKPFKKQDLINNLLKWLTNSNLEADLTKDNTSASVESYSLVKLKEISQGNEEFVKKMVALFIEQARNTVEEIKQAEQDKNYEKIRKLAHKLKPALDNLKIYQLKENIRKLEKIGTETDPEELPSLCNEFYNVLEGVIGEISENFQH